MAQSFFDIENRREYLEDLGRRHERFPYKLSEIARVGESLHKRIKDGKKLIEKGKSPKQILCGPFSMESLIHPKYGFAQADYEEFDVHSYMLALYNKNSEEPHFFPGITRADPEPIKRNSKIDEDLQILSKSRKFYENSVREINKKPRHLREFSGKFMDAFNCLYVGNGFNGRGNFINFLKKGKEMSYECDSFVLPEEKEVEFLNSVESVRPLGLKKVPKIQQDAENRRFTEQWPSRTNAYLLTFNDGKKPMVAYLNQDFYNGEYTEGVLLIANKKNKSLNGLENKQQNISKKIHPDNRVMVRDLNELEHGIGDKILSLLETPTPYYNDFLKIKQSIIVLLNRIYFPLSEIYIEESCRRKSSLEEILEKREKIYRPGK